MCFQPGRKKRPASAGRFGVAWTRTEKRLHTKNNPGCSGGSGPGLPLFGWAGCRPAGAVFPRHRSPSPVFSRRFPSRCGRGEIINLGFWWSGGSRLVLTGSSFPFPHHSKHPPLGAWASPMSPLSWPEAAGAINSVFTPTLTNVPSPPKGWKINPGNRNILADGGEPHTLPQNQSRNQRRSFESRSNGKQSWSAVGIKKTKKTLILFFPSDQDQSRSISCTSGGASPQIVLLCYMLITSAEDVDLFLCFLQLEARVNEPCVLGGGGERHLSIPHNIPPKYGIFQTRMEAVEEGNHDFFHPGLKQITSVHR